jgi:hypothetical protein
LPFKEVCFGLAMTTEQPTDHLNFGEPFDGCHGTTAMLPPVKAIWLGLIGCL